MEPLPLTDGEYESTLRDRHGFVGIEFWSFRCEACRCVAPKVSRIAEELGCQLTVFKVNVDQNPRLVAAFAIPLVPYFLILKDGQVLARLPEEWELEQIISLLGTKS